MYSLNRTKFLEPDELMALKRQFGSERDSLLIRIALETGARATEILNLTKSDLSLSSKSLFIRGIKNSNDREIPLQDDLYFKLIAYMATQASPKIFNISKSRLDQIWYFYRPVKKKFHSLRHTFAVELYKKCKDIRVVQLALGHQSVSTTQIYTSYIYSIDEMRKAILS